MYEIIKELKKNNNNFIENSVITTLLWHHQVVLEINLHAVPENFIKEADFTSDKHF